MGKVAATTLSTEDASRSLADTIAARKKAIKVSEFADLIGLSRSTVYEMVREGRLPSIQFNGTVRLDPKAIAAWLKEHGC
jgi:excisionase family DNA binding protein